MTNQAPQSPPASGLGQVLAIVQAVVALVPRWLVVAAGLVFLTWLGFELYLNLREKIATVRATEEKSQTEVLNNRLIRGVDVNTGQPKVARKPPGPDGCPKGQSELFGLCTPNRE